MASPAWDKPQRAKSRMPLIIYLVLMAACLAKIAFYASPWFLSKSSSLPIHPVGDGTSAVDDDIKHNIDDTSGAAHATAPATISLATFSPKPTTTAVPFWPWQTFKSENFTPPVLEITKTGDTDPGLLFFGPRGRSSKSQAPLIMTEDGELVWQAPANNTNNMMLQMLNGKQHIIYWEGHGAFGLPHGYGAVHIFNSSYQEVFTVCPELNILAEQDADFSCWLDMHESYMTERGTVIMSGYNVTKHDLTSIGGPMDAWVHDSLFYEVDMVSQEIIFQWSALRHLDQIPLNLTKEPLVQKKKPVGMTRAMPFDFFHINSIQPLEDGYLVSSRHTWSIFKINRNGDVEWRFSGDDGGDFLKAPEISFAWQHHVRVVKTTPETMRLQMFNNANSPNGENMTTPSSGLQIFLDFAAGTALLLRKVVDPEHPVCSVAMGSYQSLANSHSLIGYGKAKKATVKEFDALDHCIYKAEFGDSLTGSYRVYKFDWSAEPAAPPKLVSEYHEANDETELYASWNGATPDIYDNWAVYAGEVEDDFPSTTSVHDRTGFETAMLIPGKAKYYQVVARRGTLAIRNSEILQGA